MIMPLLESSEIAFENVKTGKSTTEWFLPFPGAVIDANECECVPVDGHEDIYAIVCYELTSCVGYTRDAIHSLSGKGIILL